jgi:competence protein ComEC
MAVAGMWWGTGTLRREADTCAGRWSAIAARDSARIFTRAAVVRLFDPAPAAGGVVGAHVAPGSCGGRLRLRWPESNEARAGTTWLVAGRWLGFGDRAVLVVRRARQLDPVARGRGAVRDRLARKSAALFGTRAPLVDALVIGRMSEVDARVRERYSRSGLAHLLSISGLHVGFLAAWLALLLGKLRLSPSSRFAASSLLVASYVWLLGWPAPAARAAVMLAIDGLSRLRQRVTAPRGSIALAVLVLLLADPGALRSVGAWFSVGAVVAVIWGARATAGRHLALRLLVPSIAATFITAPVSALVFGVVAPVGIALNLVAIPLGSIVVPGLGLALALSWIAEPLGALLAAGSGLGLALLDLIASIGARIPGGHVIHAAGPGPAALWVAVAVFAWWLWNAPRRRWVIAGRAALAGAILSWVLVFRTVSLDDCRCVTVHFLSVGQGDAVVLRTPANRWVVIDGGPRLGRRDAGRAVVVPFLRRRGVEQLAAVIATHGHADHLGGLSAVLEAFPSTYVLEPGEPLPQPYYLEFLAAVEASGGHWRPARSGDRLTVDDVVFEVLSPDSAWLAAPMDVNEHSVVLLVTYGGERALLTGDAGVPVEQRLAGRVGQVRVLKVGHHGSRSATSDAWLRELRPREAVISVGKRNSYGHPAPDVIERLEQRGIPIRRTDREGTITIVLDGKRGSADISGHD